MVKYSNGRINRVVKPNQALGKSCVRSWVQDVFVKIEGHRAGEGKY